jgi:hypothetical protein
MHGNTGPGNNSTGSLSRRLVAIHAISDKLSENVFGGTMRLIILLCTFTCLSLSQEFIEFYPEGTYATNIPSPAAFLGYEIGQRFTDYRNLERYLEKLSSTSDRVKMITYGETYEGRPLRTLIISNPTNLSRLEEIKQANKKLTDPRLIGTQQELDALIHSLPVIVYFSYGVHGNESSSTEAAMQVAYQLCAGTDHRTLAILEQCLVILDPLVNPDGRERYVQWFQSTVGKKLNANPDAMEHSEPWPGGRTNHYYFDLNRDLSWLTQKETAARVAFYRDWMPHVHVDYHEMSYTSTYFFFPAAPPFHETLPDDVKKWGRIFGKGNAEAFDKLGIPYYVGEDFDMFYPGYGDSWPTFNGAIGMTYEQAGHGRAGLAIRKPSGEILTLRERARNHFITSIATLETSVSHRTERLRDFVKFWQTGLHHDGKVKAYLLKEGVDPNRAAKLISLLLKQGVEVHRLQSDVRIQATPFYSKSSRSELFPKGTYVISLRQPHSRLANALLEPVAIARDTFFYDVSAWSLPVAYGVQAFTTESSPPSSLAKLDSPPAMVGGIIGRKARYAYLIPWERSDAAKLVWQLLQKKYRLTVATRPFEMMGKYFGEGTVIAAVGSNEQSLHDDIADLAREYGVDVYATNTGMAEKGISLGSNRVRPIKSSEIAIVGGPPTFANDYGELWHLFDHEFEIPTTSIRASELTDIDLFRYDVLVFPDGGQYQSVFDSARIAKLKRWVESGGILVGVESAARFFTKSKSGLTAAVLKSEKKEEEKTKEEKEEEKARKERRKRLTAFELSELERLEHIPGTIFKAIIDTTHPIGFGMPRELFVLKGNGEPFELAESGFNVGRFTKDTVQVSGYVTAEKAKRIADSGYILAFDVGRGKVVLFAESVTFRMFWTSLPKLLLNAVLFLPQPR